MIISDDSVNFERLVDGKCPLLLDHDHEKQIGVVEKAYIEDGKLKAIVRFSKNTFPQEILADIKNDIRRNVSFGYMIDEYRMLNNNTVMEVTKFTPYEVSIVSVPADPNVGYKRNLEIKENTNMKKKACGDEKITETKEVMEEDKVETIDDKVETDKVETETNPETEEETDKVETTETTKTIEEEKTDEEEIRALGDLLNKKDLASEFIKNKRSLKEFKTFVKNINSNKNENTKENKNMRFSISKAIRNACSQYKGDISQDYETKVIAENKRSLHADEYDVVVRQSQLRALAPSGTVGGALVNTDYLPQEFTPYLRPQLTLDKTGYKTIPSDGEPVSIAVQISGAVAAMYDLDGTLNDGDMNFVLKTLTPHKAGVCIPIPYSLLLQARPEIDAIVEADVVNALAELRDKMILCGTGADNQPSGIITNPDVNTMAPSSIFTWAGVVKAEQLIRDSNDFSQNLCWVMNGTNKTKMETTLKDSNGFAGYLCEDDKIKGYPVFVNNALDDNTVILGNFEEVIVTDFDGLYMKVDDITYIKKGAVQVIVTSAFDTILRRPRSFTVTKSV